MLLDLIRAVLAAAAAAVLPGYFWAVFLRPAAGIGERLAYSTALSMASVPVVAVLVARLSGGGVQLWVALVSALAVFGGGALACRLKGVATGTAGPLLPRPAPVTDLRALFLITAGFLGMLAFLLDSGLPAGEEIVVAALLVAGGVLAGSSRAGGGAAARQPSAAGASPADSAPADSGPADSGPAENGPAENGRAEGAPSAGAPAAAGVRPPAFLSRPWGPDAVLALILALTGGAAYAGVIRFDWPWVRGTDQYSHAVMAEQMLTHGQYNGYLVYPPGFSTLTAVICRFAGLPPLAVYPVLAPALTMLAPLAAYALAKRLWGWEYGLAAAGLSGFILTGAYYSFYLGRYPDLVGAYFLIVMAVAALAAVLESPSARSGALLVTLAASVVFYHQVATIYLGLLMGLVTVVSLGYLLWKRDRGQARAVAIILAGVAVAAAVYGAYIYNLPGLITGKSATSAAVSVAVGSQPPFGWFHLPEEIGTVLAWLGLLGVVALAASLRRLGRPAQVLCVLTLVLWCAFMYLGSRTAADGFPQRFERDLGAPLTITAAFALGLVVQSMIAAWRDRQSGVRLGLAMTLTAAVALAACGQWVHNVQNENHFPPDELPTHAVWAAGQWLHRHRLPGNVLSTPYLSPGITSRTVLALGWYTGLQSYKASRLKNPRSLPTAGKQALLDANEVLTRPRTCRAGNILTQSDIRYIMLYKTSGEADVAGFASDPSRYQIAYQNRTVIIYTTVRPRVRTCPSAAAYGS